MKKVFTLVISLILPTLLTAQNPLLFGLGTPREQVVNYLAKKEYVRMDSCEGCLTAQTEGYRIFYLFNNENLFRMVLTANYDKKKDADFAMTAFKNYYLSLQAEIIDMSFDRQEVTHFTAVRDGRSYEVSLHTTGDEGREIQVIATDLDLSPDAAGVITLD